MITKYGYIARVFNPDMCETSIPDKAWMVAECSQYPEVHCIDPQRAISFCDGIGEMLKNNDALAIERNVKLLLFDKWQDILKSFNGKEPEIIFYGNPSDVGENFIYTPENLKIKLRVLLDKNGNQCKIEKSFMQSIIDEPGDSLQKIPSDIATSVLAEHKEFLDSVMVHTDKEMNRLAKFILERFPNECKNGVNENTVDIVMRLLQEKFTVTLKYNEAGIVPTIKKEELWKCQ